MSVSIQTSQMRETNKNSEFKFTAYEYVCDTRDVLIALDVIILIVVMWIVGCCVFSTNTKPPRETNRY